MLWLISNPIFQLVAGAMISFGGSVWANYLFYGKVAKSRAPFRANIPETPVVLLINEQGEKEKGRDEGEFSWCSFLQGLWLARNGAKASEASRSAVERQPKRSPARRRSRRLIPKWLPNPSGVLSPRSINNAS